MTGRFWAIPEEQSRPSETLVDRTIEPRLNQILVPILSIIPDPTVHADLRELARGYQRDALVDRAMGTEAEVLDVISELLLLADDDLLSVKEITARFTERFGEEYERKITPRWIGSVLRKRLGLKPYKSDGTFVITFTPRTRATLDRLAAKYGVSLPPATSDSPIAASEGSAVDLATVRF